MAPTSEGRTYARRVRRGIVNNNKNSAFIRDYFEGLRTSKTPQHTFFSSSSINAQCSRSDFVHTVTLLITVNDEDDAVDDSKGGAKNDSKETFGVSVQANICIRQSFFLRSILAHEEAFKDGLNHVVYLKDVHDPVQLKAVQVFLNIGIYKLMHDKDNYLPTYKTYLLADYLGMPWLKKQILDKLYWGFRRQTIFPDTLNLHWLFQRDDRRAQGLLHLVFCAWGDALLHHRKRAVAALPQQTNLDFQKNFWRLRTAVPGIYGSTIGSPLRRLTPSAFYDGHIEAAVRKQAIKDRLESLDNAVIN